MSLLPLGWRGGPAHRARASLKHRRWRSSPGNRSDRVEMHTAGDPSSHRERVARVPRTVPRDSPAAIWSRSSAICVAISGGDRQGESRERAARRQSRASLRQRVRLGRTSSSREEVRFLIVSAFVCTPRQWAKAGTVAQCDSRKGESCGRTVPGGTPHTSRCRGLPVGGHGALHATERTEHRVQASPTPMATEFSAWDRFGGLRHARSPRGASVVVPDTDCLVRCRAGGIGARHARCIPLEERIENLAASAARHEFLFGSQHC